MYGPANLPESITNALNAVALRTMATPGEKEWLRQNGAAAGTMTAPQFRKFVQEELDKWTAFNKVAHVQIE